MFYVLKSVDHINKEVSFSVRKPLSWPAPINERYYDPRYPNSKKYFTLETCAPDEKTARKFVGNLEAAYVLIGYKMTLVKPN